MTNQHLKPLERWLKTVQADETVFRSSLLG
jgi:hypothetical protein